MKIAMLTYNTKPRGGVVHATYLAENLQKMGLDVHIFSLCKKEEKAEFYREIDVPYTIFSYKAHRNIVKSVEEMIKTYAKNLPKDYDIYHTQDCVGAIPFVC